MQSTPDRRCVRGGWGIGGARVTERADSGIAARPLPLRCASAPPALHENRTEPSTDGAHDARHYAYRQRLGTLSLSVGPADAATRVLRGEALFSMRFSFGSRTEIAAVGSWQTAAMDTEAFWRTLDAAEDDDTPLANSVTDHLAGHVGGRDPRVRALLLPPA